MTLSIAERKHLMPFGAQKEIAAQEKVDRTYVTRVMNGEVIAKSALAKKKLRRVQVACARRLRRPVDDVFPQQAHTQQETPHFAEAS